METQTPFTKRMSSLTDCHKKDFLQAIVATVTNLHQSTSVRLIDTAGCTDAQRVYAIVSSSELGRSGLTLRLKMEKQFQVAVTFSNTSKYAYTIPTVIARPIPLTFEAV